MSQHKNYLIQVLESIGTPLLNAVAEVCADDASIPPEARPQEEARRIASLLSKTVQNSIEIGKLAGLNEAPNIEELRLSLATLSSHLIANHYRHTKKLPEDDDLQAITSSMQAVSSFTDNFILDQDTTDRLKAMGSQMKDPAAAQIQTLRAFLPVILAIGSFSFSKTESQFIQEVSTKITAKCDSVMDMVFAGLSDDEKKLAKIHVLGMLCDIYAGCHNAEVKRLTKLDGEAKAVITTQASIDEILKTSISALQSFTHWLIPFYRAARAWVAQARLVEVLHQQQPIPHRKRRSRQQYKNSPLRFPHLHPKHLLHFKQSRLLRP